MKYLIIVLITASSVYAQPDVNSFGEANFNDIMINGKSIQNIKNTNGDQTLMFNLFGNAANVEQSATGKSIKFVYNGFSVSFGSYVSDGSNLTLSSFEIESSAPNLTIDSINISVGDNISVLSPLNLVVNNGGNYPTGIKGYIIAPCEKCDKFIYIEYSQINNTIVNIGYTVLT